jgi:hypothetical protein
MFSETLRRTALPFIKRRIQLMSYQKLMCNFIWQIFKTFNYIDGPNHSEACIVPEKYPKKINWNLIDSQEDAH